MPISFQAFGVLVQLPWDHPNRVDNAWSHQGDHAENDDAVELGGADVDDQLGQSPARAHASILQSLQQLFDLFHSGGTHRGLMMVMVTRHCSSSLKGK